MGRSISIIWSVEDVQAVRSDLNEQQSMLVLKSVKDHHDAEVGVSWLVLECWANALYPIENE